MTHESPVAAAGDERIDSTATLPADIVDSYRRNGLVQLRSVLSPTEVPRYAAAARMA